MRKVAVLFGGRSREHEISIMSASAVISALSTAGFEPVQIGIGKRGDWFHITSNMDDIVSLDDSRIETLVPDGKSAANDGATHIEPCEIANLADFAFPVLHGPYGEDGTVQGLLEMIGIPYAGCGVAASAIAMDKIFSKELFIRAGLPVCGYTATYASDFANRRDEELCRIEAAIGYPAFVKPANMGSSVGISRATIRSELSAAIDDALNYDRRILIETEVRGRELETAILGNDEPLVGAVGEIITDSDFYDYDTKYKGAGVRLNIPADISDDLKSEIAKLARTVFKTLDGAGFARVDFFLEDETGRLCINEMNTIPGFTEYSMFPLLWEEEGVDFAELVERIVELGYERYYAKNHW
jgi:D-alanine-D-alanine ligase